MPAKHPAADTPASEVSTTFRDVAVARVVDPARQRAERRVQRFLDAALDLMTSAPGKDFTVQEVVERSGQSLRSFYQYFNGKYELLLALFEESVRSTADHLRNQIGEQIDPFERLHLFTVGYFRMCAPPPKGESPKMAPATALAEFAQQLLTEHPKEAARAFVPLVSLYVELLDEAAAAGRVRSGVSHHRVAGTVLQAIMFNVFSATIGGSAMDGSDDADPAEELWEVLIHGIESSPGGSVAAKPART